MFGLFKKKPNARDVLNRIGVLHSVVTYAQSAPPFEFIEESYRQWSDEEKNEYAKHLQQTSDEYCDNLKEAGLWKAASVTEKAFLQSVSLKHERQQLINASWRVEAAVPLFWALGFLEKMPLFDEPADESTFELLEKDNFTDYELRSAAEIEVQRSLAELWHWRSRTRELIEAGETIPVSLSEKTGVKTYDEIVRTTAKLAHEQGDLPQVIDEDFAVKGKAYRDMNAEEWSEVRSITAERHFALNWRAGYAPKDDWDQTPTGT